MNTENMKKVVILLDNNKYEIEVNSDIFEDYRLEACTQVVEKLFNLGVYKVTPFMYCEDIDTSGVTPTVNVATYNTYKVIINASFHDKAEKLRQIFLNQNNIDLATEPIQGNPD
jgi:hypothetical protein